MGLIKKITHKGVDLEYWHILDYKPDKFSNATKLLIVPFKDKAARIASRQNFFACGKIEYMIPGYGITLKEMYETLVATSKIMDVVTQRAVPEIRDPEGNLIAEEIPQITEEKETNFFFGALQDSD